MIASPAGTVFTPPMESGIVLLEVRVRNFRCLQSVDVLMDDYIVLIGENNSGKSSFVDALFAAIGAGQKNINRDDIFIAVGETEPPRERAITIDLLFRPVDVSGTILNRFPGSSSWLTLWGNGVMQDDDGHDFVVIRTQMKWNQIKAEYVIERRFLKEWQKDSGKSESSKPADVAPITSIQLEPLAFYLLDAQRDIVNDLRSRTSMWSRMVSDHGLSEEQVTKLEESLSSINAQIVEGSKVLSHIQIHLGNFHNLLSCEREGVTITPLTRHLRDLGKGIDIVLSTQKSSSFPLQRQSMGTRSLGTVLTFWAHSTWRQQQFGKDAVHPLLGLEEPEAHLHPQAQRALFRQISSQMPGQRIVTTHSPYIAGMTRISKIRHFLKTRDKVKVSALIDGVGENPLSVDEIRKIDQQILTTRGELLFAKAIVLFEGETEEMAIPDFAEAYWKEHPNDLGITMVRVGGYGDYKTFLRFADSFNIPWFIFSDGEADAINKLDQTLTSVGQDSAVNNNRVVVLPSGDNFEKYLVNEDTKDHLIKMVVSSCTTSEAHQTILETEWKEKTDPLPDLIKQLEGRKTLYGSKVGKLLGGAEIFPEKIKTLLDKIKEHIGPVHADNSAKEENKIPNDS